MHGGRIWILALGLAACADEPGPAPGDATGGASASGLETTTVGSGVTENGGDTTIGTSAPGSGGVLTGEASTGAATDDEGGLPMGDGCRVAEDCVLDDDCCHCAVYSGQLPEGHGCAVESCEQSTCEAYGIPSPAPLCLDGNCLLPKVSCDPTAVVCDEAPPMCDGGQAAQILDGCYTQACIPLSSCEEVAYFSCDECEVGERCVRFSACSGDACGSWNACLPDSGAAVVNCATAGDALCGYFGPAYACFDEPSGPYCCFGDAGICGRAG